MTKHELEEFKKDIKRLCNLNLINSEYYADIIALVTELINKCGVILKLLDIIDLSQLELYKADK